MKQFLILLAMNLLATSAVAQENWPQWRGPDGNGVATDGQYPVEFSKSKNIAWKAELPGRGSSTPAVWGDLVFVTCSIEGEDGAICFDMEGNERWRQKLGKEVAGKHRNGSGSNASPIATGDYVIVYYKSATVACLTHDGKLVWKKNLVDEYGEDTLWWDRATSPVLAAGKAVIAVMQDTDSYLVAYDLATGDVVWKTARNYDVNTESNHAYTTPVVLDIDGTETIVSWGADHLDGHDAKSGKRLWHCGGFNPDDKQNWRVIASAAVDSQVAVVPFGRANFVKAVKVSGASGDVTSSHVLWEKVNLGADVPTPLLHGDQVILLSDKGKVSCFDKLTGEEKWQANLPRGRGKYFASPVLAGDTLYCAREDGVIMVARVNNGLEMLSENKMGEPTIATPIPIRGKLLVRGADHLFLIDG